jgi:hypothetical protein
MSGARVLGRPDGFIWLFSFDRAFVISSRDNRPQLEDLLRLVRAARTPRHINAKTIMLIPGSIG